MTLVFINELVPSTGIRQTRSIPISADSATDGIIKISYNAGYSVNIKEIAINGSRHMFQLLSVNGKQPFSSFYFQRWAYPKAGLSVPNGNVDLIFCLMSDDHDG